MDPRTADAQPRTSPSEQPAHDKFSVLIVQDHPLLASAIAKIFDEQRDFRVDGIATTGAEAIRRSSEHPPDVVLIDHRLPDIDGPSAAARIQSLCPSTAIVFHSAEESDTALLDAVDAGAIAYLTKDATADQLVEAVRRAAQGEVLIPVGLFARAIARQRTEVSQKRERDSLMAQFTPRELDVLHLLAEGLDTQDMSDRLRIAPHTVEWHVRHVIEKLGVHSKLQAVIAAARRGLIEL